MVNKPVFIGGTGSSGSTALSLLIESHPAVFGMMEPTIFLRGGGSVVDLYRGEISRDDFNANLRSKYLRKIMETQASFKMSNIGQAYNVDSISRLSALPITEMMRNFVKLGLSAFGKARFLCKEPHSIKDIDVIGDIFPDVKFIHIIRNPLDVCASMLSPQSWFSGGGATIRDAALFYKDVMELAYESYTTGTEIDYTILQLEDLVSDTAGVIGELSEFCELDFSEAMVNIDKDQANIDRHKTDLDKDEIRVAKEECFPIYEKWLSLSGNRRAC